MTGTRLFRCLMALMFTGLLATVLIGCPKPGPSPVTPPDASDASPPAAKTCAEACANVNRLGCKNPDACGALCPRVLNPAFRTCVATATSCDAVKRCDVGVGNE